MPWGVAAAVGGALISSRASKKAADKQADAAREDRAYQENIYNTQREDQKPWQEAGVKALDQLQDPSKGWADTFDLTKFQTSPGYQNRVESGQKAIERSAALRGSLNSGKTLKAITRWGQEQGSNEYEQARKNWMQDKAVGWDQLAQLAGYGPSATSSLVGAGNALGGRAQNTFVSEGNAGAAGTVGGANAWSNAATQVGDWYAKRPQSQTTNTIWQPNYDDTTQAFGGWTGQH